MPILERSVIPSILLDDGPQVVVEVSQPPQILSLLQSLGKPLPAPFIGNFLVDTGARSTVIRPDIAKNLGLKQIGITSVQTAHMPSSNHPVYVASIKIMIGNSPICIDAVQVTELALAGQKIDGLIGRDILSNKQFIYTGFTGRFSIAV